MRINTTKLYPLIIGASLSAGLAEAGVFDLHGKGGQLKKQLFGRSGQQPQSARLSTDDRPYSDAVPEFPVYIPGADVPLNLRSSVKRPPGTHAAASGNFMDGGLGLGPWGPERHHPQIANSYLARQEQHVAQRYTKVPGMGPASAQAARPASMYDQPSSPLHDLGPIHAGSVSESGHGSVRREAALPPVPAPTVFAGRTISAGDFRKLSQRQRPVREARDKLLSYEAVPEHAEDDIVRDEANVEQAEDEFARDNFEAEQAEDETVGRETELEQAEDETVHTPGLDAESGEDSEESHELQTPEHDAGEERDDAYATMDELEAALDAGIADLQEISDEGVATEDAEFVDKDFVKGSQDFNGATAPLESAAETARRTIRDAEELQRQRTLQLAREQRRSAPPVAEAGAGSAPVARVRPALPRIDTMMLVKTAIRDGNARKAEAAALPSQPAAALASPILHTPRVVLTRVGSDGVASQPFVLIPEVDLRNPWTGDAAAQRRASLDPVTFASRGEPAAAMTMPDPRNYVRSGLGALSDANYNDDDDEPDGPTLNSMPAMSMPSPTQYTARARPPIAAYHHLPSFPQQHQHQQQQAAAHHRLPAVPYNQQQQQQAVPQRFSHALPPPSAFPQPRTQQAPQAAMTAETQQRLLRSRDYLPESTYRPGPLAFAAAPFPQPRRAPLPPAPAPVAGVPAVAVEADVDTADELRDDEVVFEDGYARGHIVGHAVASRPAALRNTAAAAAHAPASPPRPAMPMSKMLAAAGTHAMAPPVVHSRHATAEDDEDLRERSPLTVRNPDNFLNDNNDEEAEQLERVDKGKGRAPRSEPTTPPSTVQERPSPWAAAQTAQLAHYRDGAPGPSALSKREPTPAELESIATAAEYASALRIADEAEFAEAIRIADEADRMKEEEDRLEALRLDREYNEELEEAQREMEEKSRLAALRLDREAREASEEAQRRQEMQLAQDEALAARLGAAVEKQARIEANIREQKSEALAQALRDAELARYLQARENR